MVRAALRLAAIVLGLSLALASAGTAQCGMQWQPVAGLPGCRGEINASVVWDPDGPGPQSELMVVGGTFLLCGDVMSRYMALYDPALAIWSVFPNGPNGTVTALLARPNGELIAAGYFTDIGGVTAGGMARLMGSTWSALGPAAAPLPSLVTCLAIAPNGDLIAGGSFDSIGGTPANRIARWNGATWSPIGAGFASNVRAVAVRPNGELFAAGTLGYSGTTYLNHVARWTGTSWENVGNGLNDNVNALLVHSNGELIAGGNFTGNGGPALLHVAKWNGLAWAPMAAGLGGPTNSDLVAGLLEEPNGDVVAVGSTPGPTGIGIPILRRWNGATWAPLVAANAPSLGKASAVARTATGDLVVRMAGGFFSMYLARCIGGTWLPPDTAFDNLVRSFVTGADGSLIAGGDFTLGDGLELPFVARHDGASWQPLGSGTNHYVNAVDVLPGGDVVVGGSFTAAGSVATYAAARWNGSQWSAMSLTSGSYVSALAHSPVGEVFAAHSDLVPSSYRVSRWNGSSWMQLGPLFTDMILTLAVLPNGDVVAGGAFTNVASRIARWNGTTWLPLGSGMDDSVFDLLVLPGGDLLAAGLFTNAGGVQASNVARWNGSTWSALGAGPGGIARTLALLPNGDVLAGGSFGGGIALSRWNGSWSPVATSSPGPAVVLELRADGSVVTGHLASFTGSTALGYLRMASTTCPATATAYGAGCAGSAGPMVLTATALPWVGSVCHTRCVGFAPLSVGIVAAGMGQLSLPLALVLPSAGAGCSVLARPDVLELRFPVAGAVNWQLTVPNVPSLVGTQVHHQMAQLELDAGLQIVGSASSQALTLTVGVF